MKIMLVHGFNVRDRGRRSIDRLQHSLRRRGHNVDTDSADYGWHNLIMVRFFSRGAVKRIARGLEKCDVVVTHSNGANYVQKALKRIKKDVIVIHLSPALNRRTKPPRNVTRCHVLHTRHDNIVKLAAYLVKHPWGSMGAHGYTGLDPRVINHDFTHRVRGHSGWFKALNVPYFAGFISNLLEQS